MYYTGSIYGLCIPIFLTVLTRNKFTYLSVMTWAAVKLALVPLTILGTCWFCVLLPLQHCIVPVPAKQLC